MSRDDLRLPTWRYAWLLEISGLTVRYYAGQAPPTRSIGWGGVDYTDLPLITGVGSQTSRLTALGGVAEMGSITVTLTGQRGATGDHDPVTLLLRNGRRDSTRVARLAASLPHDTPAVDVTLDRDVTGWPTVGGREIFHLGVETLVAQTTRTLSAAILDISAVGFLGLGAQSPQPEWGTMLADSSDLIYLAPWTVTLPGIAILFSVLVTNLVGEGIREALKEGND